MDQNQENSNEIRGMTLADVIHSTNRWFRYLLPKWWIFLLVGLAAGAAGFYYASLSKTNYQSRLTFALEDNTGGVGSAFSLASELGFNLGGGKDVFAGDNVITILTSRKILERVLLSVDTINGKQTTFADELIKISDLRKTLMKNQRYAKVSFPVGINRKQLNYLQDSILFVLQENIVENKLTARRPDKKYNLYEITLITPEERFSKVFIEKLLHETTTFYTELKSKRSRETMQILDQRVASLRGSLSSAISSRASTQDANLNPAFAASQIPVQNKQVDISVYGGAYGELYKNLEMARYQYLRDIPLLQVIDEPNYPMKKIKMGRLKTAEIFAFVAGVILLIFFTMRRYLKTISLNKK